MAEKVDFARDDRLTLIIGCIAVASFWMWAIFWSLPLLLWYGYDLEGYGTSCAPNYFDKREQ